LLFHGGASVDTFSNNGFTKYQQSNSLVFVSFQLLPSTTSSRSSLFVTYIPWTCSIRRGGTSLSCKQSKNAIHYGSEAKAAPADTAVGKPRR
jgi:hypothetical protein